MWPTGKTNSIRLDDYLVAGAWFADIKVARSNIMQGNVLLDDNPQTKPGFQISLKKEAPLVRIRNQKKWVARSAEKLAGYLRRFPFDLKSTNAIDIGCGPGGFSQVLLEGGASSVVMVDIAFNIVDVKLRESDHTVILERTHVKSLHPSFFYPDSDWPDELWERREQKIEPVVDWQLTDPLLITGDISFLPLAEYIAALLSFGFVLPRVNYILLIKPQFELPAAGESGVITDPGQIKQACLNFLSTLQEFNSKQYDQSFKIAVNQLAWSTLTGRHGNREVLIGFSTQTGAPGFEQAPAVDSFLAALV